jgi:hypothetical protein
MRLGHREADPGTAGRGFDLRYQRRRAEIGGGAERGPERIAGAGGLRLHGGGLGLVQARHRGPPRVADVVPPADRQSPRVTIRFPEARERRPS